MFAYVMWSYRATNGALAAVSYSVPYPLKTRSKNGHVAANIVFYGDEVGHLLDHVRHQLIHLTENICTNGDRCNLYPMAHFPLALDRKDADSALRAELPFLELTRNEQSYIIREPVVRQTSAIMTTKH